MNKIQQIQAILGVDQDGLWGSKSRAALDNLIQGPETKHLVKATSFADPRDIARFRLCKASGKSDEECFKIGDNGIGCWGADVTVNIPMCALPPEDMERKWGSVDAAKDKLVVVSNDTHSTNCILADRMPHERNIRNGAGIDLNPAACSALGLTPPVFASVAWQWA